MSFNYLLGKNGGKGISGRIISRSTGERNIKETCQHAQNCRDGKVRFVIINFQRGFCVLSAVGFVARSQPVVSDGTRSTS